MDRNIKLFNPKIGYRVEQAKKNPRSSPEILLQIVTKPD